MSARHIAVVNFTRMGDLIQSGPLMRSLRETDDRLTLIVYEGFRGVAERLPMVDDVVALDLDDLLAHLSGRGMDLPQALHVLREFVSRAPSGPLDELWNLAHTPLSATLCGLMGAKQKHGLVRQADGQLSVRGNWFLYLLSVMERRTDNPFNLVEIYLRLGGRRNRLLPLEFAVTEADRVRASELLAEYHVGTGRPYVVLQPGASSPSRQWPAASFADLSRMLARQGFRPVVVGSASEVDLGREVAQRSGGTAVSLCGETDVGTLAAVVERAHRLISNDTGTIHLAAAVKTPCVGIYLGPASAKDTAPFGDGHIVIEPDLACAPCGYHDVCASPSCRSAVRVEDVFAFATAESGDAKARARRMRAIRVFNTRLSPDDGFKLDLWNAPAHTPHSEELAFHRHVWDSLLSSVGCTEKPAASEWCMDTEKRRQAIAELQSIAHAAEEALAEERSRALRVSPRLLKEHSTWQRRLQAFALTNGPLTSLATFVLTHTRYARLNTAAEFREDLRASVTMLTRGLRVVRAADAARAATAYEHA